MTATAGKTAGPSAFVDLLAPPYEQEKGRDCTYFRECDPSTINQSAGLQLDNNDRWLMEISPPREFYCDTQPYSGPPVTLQLISGPSNS